MKRFTLPFGGSAPGRRLLWAFLACGAILAAGCSSKTKLVTVKGKVMVGDKPLRGGIVTFVPDEAKGNKSKDGAVGMIQSDGSYELHTEDKEGAPPGWYKVVVRTGMMPGADVKLPPKDAAAKEAEPQVQVNPKYGSAETTDLSIEVVDSAKAGAYDLKLTE